MRHISGETVFFSEKGKGSWTWDTTVFFPSHSLNLKHNEWSLCCCRDVFLYFFFSLKKAGIYLESHSIRIVKLLCCCLCCTPLNLQCAGSDWLVRVGNGNVVNEGKERERYGEKHAFSSLQSSVSSSLYPLTGGLHQLVERNARDHVLFFRRLLWRSFSSFWLPEWSIRFSIYLFTSIHPSEFVFDVYNA